MRNIIIVECISTGINYIEDIRNRNYNPIVLNTKFDETNEDESYNELVMNTIAGIDDDIEVIVEKDSYSETLELVKKYNPLLIIPGSERGDRLATKLSHDLGLQGNPVENIDAYTLKDKMQEKIAEKGLRCIRGKTISTIEEALEFYEEENLKKVVVKPVYSAGAVGVKMCENREELIESLNELFEDVNYYGQKVEKLIIQERIIGNEYIVNTASCNGVHRITTMWDHIKTVTPSGDNVLDSSISINELSLGQGDLIEYVYDVLDALEIRYGGVHGEYIVDEKGPVLIEVNCRPMGSSMDAKFLDSISGQHETDSILDSYLNPRKFHYKRNQGYELYEYGAIKYLIVPKDIVAESAPIKYIASNLKSHYKTSQELSNETKFFVKTENLETIGGVVYLHHPDGFVLQKDLDFLRNIENYAFQLVLSDNIGNKVTKISNDYSEVRNILKMIYAYEPAILVTDHILDDADILQILPEEVDAVNSEFDCVVLNLDKSIINERDDNAAYLILKIIELVKTGGIILIPKSTYQYMPNGRIGVEALIKVLGLKLEMPISDLKGCVVASKK